jgi:hypothetical protein
MTKVPTSTPKSIITIFPSPSDANMQYFVMRVGSGEDRESESDSDLHLSQNGLCISLFTKEKSGSSISRLSFAFLPSMRLFPWQSA